MKFQNLNPVHEQNSFGELRHTLISHMSIWSCESNTHFLILLHVKCLTTSQGASRCLLADDESTNKNLIWIRREPT